MLDASGDHKAGRARTEARIVRRYNQLRASCREWNECSSEAFAIFVVEQFLRVVEQQGFQSAALVQYVLPERKEERNQTRA